LAAEYRFLADARQITMETHLSESLIIQGDAEKLHRAFSNILDNAVKYNTDGGRIELTAAPFGAGAAVTVFNTGPGIAEAEIPKVFDQFYRVEKSRSIQHGGSGLGLAIVKRIVELHGGTVRLESRQGAWTRVTVLLPEAGNTAGA
jgi:signal transduction histidine kinase